MKTGIIADIQRASVHDGPGFRTTVFFKGCPLKCEWCHNPECIDFQPQILCYPEKCIGCGRCKEGCFAGAKVLCGRKMSVEEVIKEILQDKDYYGEEGGVTFSGGEPLAQKDFLNALIDECRKQNIRCAVETSLIYYDEELFHKLDFVMADLKIWDSELHKKYTGVDNQEILSHFRKLDNLNIPIIARTPVIPEIDQGIAQISEFFRGLKNIVKYELLPYHPLGEAKRTALGKEKKVFTVPGKEFMDQLTKYEFERIGEI